jgi:hypothetical protein
MNKPSSRHVQLGILLLALAGLGVTAWRGAAAVEKTRAARNHLEAELASLRTKERAAVMATRKLEETTPETPSGKTPVAAQTPEEATVQWIEETKRMLASAPPRARLVTPPSGPHGNVYFPELFDDPAYVELVKKIQRPGLEKTYGAFLETLEGSPETKARYVALLLERAVALLDTSSEGAPSTAREAAIDRIRRVKPFDEEIDELLGAGKSLERQLTQSYPVCEIVKPFATRLSYSANPLSRVQENQLIDLINRAPWNRDTLRIIDEQKFPPEVVAEAARILSPAQWQALQKFAGTPSPNPTRFSPGVTTGR